MSLLYTGVLDESKTPVRKEQQWTGTYNLKVLASNSPVFKL